MEFKVKRADKLHPASVNRLTVEGSDLIDAFKRNFKRILEVSTYHHVPFGYPMTVKPVYVQTIPDNAIVFKNDGKGGTVVDDNVVRGHIELKLEWMHSNYADKRDESIKTHTIYIDGSAADVTDTTPFVILGN